MTESEKDQLRKRVEHLMASQIRPVLDQFVGLSQTKYLQDFMCEGVLRILKQYQPQTTLQVVSSATPEQVAQGYFVFSIIDPSTNRALTLNEAFGLEEPQPPSTK